MLFELGLELSKWRKKTEYEESVDFSYKTMDYDDEAILLFKKCMDRNNWKISSIWQLFESNEEIEHELLMNAVDNFLHELEIQLFEFYNINFKDYLDNV